jgi:translation initiation factor 1
MAWISSAPGRTRTPGTTSIGSGIGEILRQGRARYRLAVVSSYRLVYSTGKGPICPTCAWPEKECHCSSRTEEPVPAKVTAKLRLQTKGRAGRSVTVVDGLPRNTAFLKDLSKALKSALGTGGAVRDGAIEIQGDHRERLRTLLAERGFAVKG